MKAIIKYIRSIIFQPFGGCVKCGSLKAGDANFWGDSTNEYIRLCDPCFDEMKKKWESNEGE